MSTLLGKGAVMPVFPIGFAVKRLISCSIACVVLVSLPLSTFAISSDAVVVLERTGCLGSCPDYKVTIHGDGDVVYEGHSYVAITGIRKSKIPPETVAKLVRELHSIDFFHWQEKEDLCVDYPETRISATDDDQSKLVVEGCSRPGRILDLANEIDALSGAKRLVGKPRR